MENERIDKTRLDILIMWAKVKDNYTNPELGGYVSAIVKIVLSQDCFRLYSEDWREELRSEATLNVLNSLKNVKTGEGDAFSFIYGVAQNTCRRHLLKLKNGNVPLSDEVFSDTQAVPTKASYRKNNPYKQIKKMVLLKNAVGRSVQNALESFKISQINYLIRMAKANREAIC